MNEPLLAGVHEIPIDAYHADPCFDVSLSSSGLRRLIEATPAHFHASNPRLNQDCVKRAPTKEQDLGAVVHSLILGRGAEFRVCDVADKKTGEAVADWKTGAAQDFRDQARAEGFIPILQKTAAKAAEISGRAIDALIGEFGEWPIGKSEQTLIWQQETPNEGPVWCRALADHLAPDRALILDPKSTSLGLSDDDLARKIALDGLDVQAAHYLNGLEILFPEIRGRGRFIFVFVEVEAPFAVRFVELPESWLNLTRQRIDNAADLFARCLRTNEWPSWGRIAQLRLPTWIESRWTEQLLSQEIA